MTARAHVTERTPFAVTSAPATSLARAVAATTTGRKR